MNFKEKAKRTLLSALFNGTYREYRELKQKEVEHDELNKSRRIEENNLNDKLHEFELENEQLKNVLCDKEKEIKKSYSGNQGLMDEINFLKFRNQKLIDLHDETVEKYWSNDRKLKEYVCVSPFENIDILPRGEVYTCCSGFVKHNHYIGNINTESFDQIWNSKKAKQLRYCVSMGNFEYCNSHCRELKIGVVNKPGNYLKGRGDYSFSYNSYEECQVNSYPKQISLSCDESCNLYCVSCRNKRKILSSDESEKIYKTLVDKLLPYLKDCNQLTLLGTGDFFVSQASMKFVKHITHEKYPQLTLYLVTNAQLFNEKNWSEFDNLKNVPINVAISIDAANKDTYEKLRRGGNWEILLENLEYIKSLKEDGSISFIRFNYVVQLENFRQMREFVLLAAKYNVDEVFFQRMANWGTIPEEEFSELDVFNKNNLYYNEATNLLKEIKNNLDIDIFENCL